VDFVYELRDALNERVAAVGHSRSQSTDMTSDRYQSLLPDGVLHMLTAGELSGEPLFTELAPHGALLWRVTRSPLGDREKALYALSLERMQRVFADCNKKDTGLRQDAAARLVSLQNEWFDVITHHFSSCR
jgi:hypothetical protein